MTTTVNSNHSDRTLHIIDTDGSVTVRFDAAGGRYADRVTADRAEFIRAIETELDGTWIDRADLPEVTPLDGSRVKCGNNVYHTDYDHRAEAMERLALARHLEANPPVDEQVGVFEDAITDAPLDYGPLQPYEVHALARHLVEEGFRAPEAGDVE